jgi:phosphoserine phosphatase RsbU/P
MEAQIVTAFHEELVNRRHRLERVLTQSPSSENLHYLLQEVDAALDRMEQGTYGMCETCNDLIEPERLLVDPLLRNCLDHLNTTEIRALERDLDLACEIQRGLLPKNNLQHEGWHAAYHYEPAGAVSGDYCDIIMPEVPSAPLYFNIGDVTGKGVAASILMGHLHAIFRSLVMVNLPLCDLVARANRIFCEGTGSTHFATLVSGRANAHGEVELCNAGHPYPLHVRSTGVHAISSTAVPIGLFCNGEFPSSTIAMAPGETLVLYTDGLTETTNASGEQYGEERLKSLLQTHARSSPQDILASCILDLKMFKEGKLKSDDLTILVLQRQ